MKSQSLDLAEACSYYVYLSSHSGRIETPGEQPPKRSFAEKCKVFDGPANGKVDAM